MFRTKNEKNVIVDRSAMLASPARHPLHFLYALLLGISFAAALWQYGQAQFTLALLIAVIPCSLVVFVPYRFYPSMLRAAMNCIIFGGVCFWCFFRMKGGIMPDKAILESLAAASLIFLMNGQRRDLGYLFFISMFLFIYGALIPRMLYLWLLTPYFLVLILLLYANRPVSLAGGRRVAGKRRYSLLRSWPYYLLNLLLGVAFFWYLFGIMPLTDNDIPGIFEVSFLTERDSALPPEFQQWLYGNKVKPSPSGKRIVRSGKPDTVGSQGTPIRMKNQTSQSRAEGDGGASQGKDLLFYVKSPLKLYHLAQLYDVYDGEKWTTSLRMKRSRLRNGGDISLFHQINQHYSILKWISPKLYAAFIPFSFQTGEMQLLPLRLDTTFFNAEIRATEYPPLPFRYMVTSGIVFPQKMGKPASPAESPSPPMNRRNLPGGEAPRRTSPPHRKIHERQTNPAVKQPNDKEEKQSLSAPAEKTANPAEARKIIRNAARKNRTGRPNRRPPRRQIPYDPYWPETVPKSCYLQLPKKKISVRVTELAKQLTKDLKSPYEKATALRDHLRKHYKYVLYAQKVPEGKESVDYFLFTLREGHCEYYASALAVLARAAGLPARVATGFSPGNYNTLTRQFEVHEYHAHAWTQIYIDKIGWLTFDATPPQYVRSETRPAGIGSLRDPFGDEWRITPPEMTEHTLEQIRSDIIREARKDEDSSVLEKALIKTAIAQEEIQKNIKKTYVQAKRHLDRKNKEGFLFHLEKKLFALHDKITDLLLYVRHSWIVILMFLIILLTSGSICRRAAKIASNHWKRKRMEQFIRNAGQEKHDNPGQAIRYAYFALRLALELAGFVRKRNMELLDYARSLRGGNRELAEKTEKLFLLFYKLEYGSFLPETKDAEYALELLADIRKCLDLLRTGAA